MTARVRIRPKWRKACLEVAVVKLPGGCSQVLQEAALVGEGEMEAQVPAVLPERHLAQELLAAGLLAVIAQLLVLHLSDWSKASLNDCTSLPCHEKVSSPGQPLAQPIVLGKHSLSFFAGIMCFRFVLDPARLHVSCNHYPYNATWLSVPTQSQVSLCVGPGSCMNVPLPHSR